MHLRSLKHLDLLGEFLHLERLLVVLVDVLIDALYHKILAMLELHQAQEGLETCLHRGVLKRLVDWHILRYLEVGRAQIALTGPLTALLAFLRLLPARLIVCPPRDISHLVLRSRPCRPGLPFLRRSRHVGRG